MPAEQLKRKVTWLLIASDLDHFLCHRAKNLSRLSHGFEASPTIQLFLRPSTPSITTPPKGSSHPMDYEFSKVIPSKIWWLLLLHWQISWRISGYGGVLGAERSGLFFWCVEYWYWCTSSMIVSNIDIDLLPRLCRMLMKHLFMLRMRRGRVFSAVAPHHHHPTVPLQSMCNWVFLFKVARILKKASL